jgi:hypothetical protein
MLDLKRTKLSTDFPATSDFIVRKLAQLCWSSLVLAQCNVGSSLCDSRVNWLISAARLASTHVSI